MFVARKMREQYRFELPHVDHRRLPRMLEELQG